LGLSIRLGVGQRQHAIRMIPLSDRDSGMVALRRDSGYLLN
jgi:hypothetical protein